MRIWQLGFIMATLALSANEQATGAEKAHPTTVVVFGDSTTARRKGVRQVYEQRLAELLPGVQLINAGVPGDTTDRARARFDRDVLDRQPDLVVIQFGANDSAVDVWKGATEPRVDMKRYEENLLHFLTELRKRNCRVLLMTPGVFRWTNKLKAMYGKPPYDPDRSDGFCVTLAEYANTVRELAKKHQVPLADVYALENEYGSQPGQSTDELLLDGMHPNDNGHKLITERIAPVIRQLLGLTP